MFHASDYVSVFYVLCFLVASFIFCFCLNAGRVLLLFSMLDNMCNSSFIFKDVCRFDKYYSIYIYQQTTETTTNVFTKI